MTGTFFGLETALRGLRASQAGLNATNHNIANANTDGFSRQSVELVATAPYPAPGLNQEIGAGQIGTGVVVSAISRSRDLLLDVQYRTQRGTLVGAQVSQSVLEEIEAVLNEPSSSGLASLLSEFFQSWQEVSDNPSDIGSRESLVQQSIALATGFNRAAQQLTDLQQSLNDRVAEAVVEANQLADRIASLNRQIRQAEALGQRANDLRDQRDVLVDRLAGLVGVAATEDASGFTVMLGGRALVQGSTVDHLEATPTGPDGAMEVRFESDDAAASISSGEIRGLMVGRTQILTDYLDRLDQIAGDLVVAVNSLHGAGYGLDGATGRLFFTGSDAAGIAVDGAITSDARLVAVADAPGQPGNNAIALAILALRDSQSASPEDAYRALVTALGSAVQASRAAADDTEVLVRHLQRRREEVSGVSLEEEAVAMLRYQRAYEAAARVMTAVDEMLDKLINETGVVGR